LGACPTCRRCRVQCGVADSLLFRAVPGRSVFAAAASLGAQLLGTSHLNFRVPDLPLPPAQAVPLRSATRSADPGNSRFQAPTARARARLSPRAESPLASLR